MWEKGRTWSGTDKSATGGLMTPHPYTVTHRWRDNGIVQYKPNQNLYTMTEMLGLPSIPAPPAWSPSDELKLLDKLGNQIRGHDFNAGVFAGTGRQTARTIADRASRIASGISALKHGMGPKSILDALGVPVAKATRRQTRLERRKGVLAPTEGHTALDDLSQKWLEVSYGWLPLLGDVDSAMQALARHVYGSRRHIFRVRRRLHVSEDGSDALRLWHSQRERSVDLQYMMEDGTLPSTARELGLLDPFSIAWELCPWSFVIDWFLPIGTFIRGVDLFPNISGDWVRSERTIEEWRCNAKENSTYKPVQNQHVRNVTLTRTCGSGSLSVPLPSFKSPFSSDWRRMANALALLDGLRPG